ncbi:MAG: HAD-IIA family hydrolase [Alphaproteobacteria bacterium]|nr:HAD-IIA family hydrolase [Alphaproteobacteria bacterium]
MNNASAQNCLKIDDILHVYEDLRPIMPTYSQAYSQAYSSGQVEKVARMRDLLDHFDALMLDGFGVLNVGRDIIPGAVELLTMAAEHSIPVLVVTNGATQNEQVIGHKYAEMGLPVSPPQVVSSRAAINHWLMHDRPPQWQYIGIADDVAADLTVDDITLIRLSSDKANGWADCDAIAVMGVTAWNMAWQARLTEAALAGCPILIANPDVAAPHPDRFSYEPGYFAWQLIQAGVSDIRWFGKPHQTHFEMAMKRLETITGHNNLDRKRIAMVGDTLHTDILGGAAAGLTTVLVTGHGMFRDGGAETAMAKTGIRPDFIIDTV